DFTHIVRDLFNVVFQSAQSLLDPQHAKKVATVSSKLANYYNLDEESKLDLEKYSLIHLRFDEIKDLMVDTDTYDEHTYDLIKTKTDLGSKIGKRLQLAQKCNEMMRRHHEEIGR